jgi:hypothetical protein
VVILHWVKDIYLHLQFQFAANFCSLCFSVDEYYILIIVIIHECHLFNKYVMIIYVKMGFITELSQVLSVSTVFLHLFSLLPFCKRKE